MTEPEPSRQGGGFTLRREIALIIVIKLVALAVLWQLFVSGKHVPVDRAGALDSAIGAPARPSPTGPAHDQ